MNYRLSLFAATFVFLLVFSAQLVPHSASAHKQDKPPEQDPKFLQLSSFRPNNRANLNFYLLSDGDVIMMTVEDDREIPRDQAEIVLKSDPNVTWWKSIMFKEAFKKPDGSWSELRTVNSISTQDDDHGPKAMRVRLPERPSGLAGWRNLFVLTFVKAKVLGVHTEMYEFGTGHPEHFNALRGTRVTFTWQKD